MEILLIIVFVAGVMCVAAWKCQPERFEWVLPLGIPCKDCEEARAPHRLVYWHDWPNSFNGYPWEGLQTAQWELEETTNGDE